MYCQSPVLSLISLQISHLSAGKHLRQGKLRSWTATVLRWSVAALGFHCMDKFNSNRPHGRLGPLGCREGLWAQQVSCSHLYRIQFLISNHNAQRPRALVSHLASSSPGVSSVNSYDGLWNFGEETKPYVPKRRFAPGRIFVNMVRSIYSDWCPAMTLLPFWLWHVSWLILLNHKNDNTRPLVNASHSINHFTCIISLNSRIMPMRWSPFCKWEKPQPTWGQIVLDPSTSPLPYSYMAS